MIEDAIHHAEDIARNNVKVYLLDKPWNRNFKTIRNIKRKGTWSEIILDTNNKN